MSVMCLFFFFFNDTATTEIYTLSLHDALPISLRSVRRSRARAAPARARRRARRRTWWPPLRSEEHTSELQSQSNLVCRLLLEKKKRRLNLGHIYPRPYVHEHCNIHTHHPLLLS